MSDPNTIDLLSSSDSDEEQEEKKSESEVELVPPNAEMGNCLSNDAAKRKRSPSPTPRRGSPPRSPPQTSHSHNGDRRQSHIAKRRSENSSPDVEYVPNGGGMERHYGLPSSHHWRKDGYGDSGGGFNVATSNRGDVRRRRKIPEKVSKRSDSSSSSASSSSSSFFSSVNYSTQAVRIPPPKYDKNSSTAATLSISFESTSKCISSAAVRGDSASISSSIQTRPRRHSTKEGKLRHLTIDLTGTCEDDDDGERIREENIERGGKSSGRKKRHKFSEEAGLTAVAVGVELAMGDVESNQNAVLDGDGGGRKQGKSPPSSPMSKSAHPAPSEEESPVYDEDDEDDVAVVTEGLIGYIDMYPGSATCTRPPTSSSSANDLMAASSFPRPSPHLPLHYQQRDKWSCGFRNMQMVLSALLPRMRADHPFFSMLASGRRSKRRRGSSGGSGGVDRTVPSLYRLQTYLERSWADGFDPRGARHFEHRIRGRTGRSSWIGAVEVSSLLSYFSVDSAVVQFIQRPESRALLGDFVRSYFERKVGYDGCYTCCSAMGTASSLSSTEIASELMQFASMRQSAGEEYTDVAVECCPCAVPPLYLQWEGHSVTVVGCSERKGTANFGGGVWGGSYDLLVFDPMKSGSTIKEKLKATTLEKKRNGKRTSTGNGKSLPLSGAHKDVVLSTTDLLRLDCQIVLSSPRPLSSTERSKCRAKVSALTAADN